MKESDKQYWRNEYFKSHPERKDKIVYMIRQADSGIPFGSKDNGGNGLCLRCLLEDAERGDFCRICDIRNRFDKKAGKKIEKHTVEDYTVEEIKELFS